MREHITSFLQNLYFLHILDLLNDWNLNYILFHKFYVISRSIYILLRKRDLCKKLLHTLKEMLHCEICDRNVNTL